MENGKFSERPTRTDAATRAANSEALPVKCVAHFLRVPLGSWEWTTLPHRHPSRLRQKNVDHGCGSASLGAPLLTSKTSLHDFGTGTSINKRTKHIVSAPMAMDIGCSDNLVACPHQHGAAMQEPSMTGLRLKLSRTYCSDASHKRTDQIVATPYRVSAVTHWQLLAIIMMRPRR